MRFTCSRELIVSNRHKGKGDPFAVEPFITKGHSFCDGNDMIGTKSWRYKKFSSPRCMDKVEGENPMKAMRALEEFSVGKSDRGEIRGSEVTVGDLSPPFIF